MLQSFYSKFNLVSSRISYLCVFVLVTVIFAHSSDSTGNSDLRFPVFQNTSEQSFFKKLRGYGAFLTLFKWSRKFNTSDTNMFTQPPASTTEPTTTEPTWIYEEPSGSGLLFAQIFVGISALGFVLALIIVIINNRKEMKRSFLSIAVIRDLRDILEYQRIRRAQESVRRQTEHQQRAYGEFLQLQRQYSETVLPFLVKEDGTPPPPSYDALFSDVNANSNPARSDCENEEPPPRYSVCYSSDREDINSLQI